MSLKQVNAFYEVVISDRAIYEQYLKKCCRRGFLGSCHWDKTRIVKFASTLGYQFTESELAQVLFEDEASFAIAR
ncbi:Nif11-like leader peptide family natural product precursor [Nostocaceae cyanobacterium CENA369]|uniref:Nif11-like leader peptide family natural product n=1 Tax=Dendronalium phyllosphericum CENA369 TaxID=1725256 RepID=A0A8J7I447_9NOST|nr:Nif11-like leader peptide family natural product precursor [Dendronalium phyllosphericum]MBH8573678.1 Nif11-like leader peptide family natural product precursor [Dendronalium phyllosphericum CENA369]